MLAFLSHRARCASFRAVCPESVHSVPFSMQASSESMPWAVEPALTSAFAPAQVCHEQASKADHAMCREAGWLNTKSSC